MSEFITHKPLFLEWDVLSVFWWVDVKVLVIGWRQILFYETLKMPCWYQWLCWLQGGAYTMTTTRNPRVVFKGLLVVGGIIFCYTFHSWNVLKCLISRIPTKTIYTFLFNFLFCLTQHVTEWRQQVKLLCLHFGVFQYLSILYFFHLFPVCLETLLSPDLQVLSLSFFTLCL